MISRAGTGAILSLGGEKGVTLPRVVVVGVTTVLLAGGCQHQFEPAPLREDPVLAEALAREREGRERPRATPVTTLQEAEELEAALERHPEDAAARQRLLAFYRWTGKNPQSWDDNVLARRRHALWLPERTLTRDPAR
jgi:hypothetical protein